MSEQTRCDLFGHQFSLCKEGGKTYMKCEHCPSVRHVTADDLKADLERVRGIDKPRGEPIKIDDETMARLRDLFAERNQ